MLLSSLPSVPPRVRNHKKHLRFCSISNEASGCKDCFVDPPCGITLYEKISPDVEDDLLDNLKCTMVLFHGARKVLAMTKGNVIASES
ncbi:MAG: hypothetical protein AMJ42_05760 [Deltaproteobacteria bacterium DG_8]|nr:MAG: hypothetical protein AMJ42_05760 [Deltaproteobacteria bacterium DG_8]